MRLHSYYPLLCFDSSNRAESNPIQVARHQDFPFLPTQLSDAEFFVAVMDPQSQQEPTIVDHEKAPKMLPIVERDILERQIATEPFKLTLEDLREALTPRDTVLLGVSYVCTMISGVVFPIMTILFGTFQSMFQSYLNGQSAKDEFDHQLRVICSYYAGLALVKFIVHLVANSGSLCQCPSVGVFLQLTSPFCAHRLCLDIGDKVACRVRALYLESCFRQNVAFVEQLSAGEVVARLTTDADLLRGAIAEKIPLVLSIFSASIASFAIGRSARTGISKQLALQTNWTLAYVKQWKVALTQTGTLIAFLLLIGGGTTISAKSTRRSLEMGLTASVDAEEAISSIRTTQALGCDRRLAQVHRSHLLLAQKWNYKAKFMGALVKAGVYFLQWMSYGLALWVGSKLIARGETTLGNVLTVMFVVMLGAFNLRGLLPAVTSLQAALVNTSKLGAVIRRPSPIDPSSTSGCKLESVRGLIELRHVQHRYPSRPTVQVLAGVGLILAPGKMTAIVGASGAGKSSIIGLIERFYEPTAGMILLDGHDIRDLNLVWYRQQISLVEQEPLLFRDTVLENIKQGLTAAQLALPEEAQHRAILEAARIAYAHDFISALPQGYDTNVGEKGMLLSGGQRQRIAIARAIVSDPKILLLDEPTRSLDSASEQIIQEALSAASRGRTTVVISHRPSNIINADHIAVLKDGVIIEQGTHGQLLEAKGHWYHQLTRGQADEGTFQQEPEPLDSAQAVQDAEDHQPRASGGKHATITSVSRLEDSQKRPLWPKIPPTALSFLKRNSLWLSAGLLFSILAGGCYPVQAVLLAKQIAVLSSPLASAADVAQLLRDANFWGLMYVVLAIASFATFLAQDGATTVFSERLGLLVRCRLLDSVLARRIGFFDQPENSSAALAIFISSESAHLAAFNGVIGSILLSTMSLLIGVAVSCAIGWKLGLVCASTVPLSLVAAYFRVRSFQEQQSRFKKSYESSASLAVESLGAIRAVASLTREKTVVTRFASAVHKQRKEDLKHTLRASALMALGTSLSLFCMALGVWYGGQLIAAREYTMFQFFVCFQAIIFGAESANVVFSLAPEIGRAWHSGASVASFIGKESQCSIQVSDSSDSAAGVSGILTFHNLTFFYPTRAGPPALRNVSFTVDPGAYVALVGPSGGGKTTVMSLIERFYDPSEGSISLDGKDIRSYDIRSYRSQIGYVSQEPVLYQGTIRDNIMMGVDHDAVVSKSMMEAACKGACLDDFIASLPEGIDTEVGGKGILLSGGQKQRIAIARVLLRDPKILLLDEATSSLDLESERIVGKVFGSLARGRTTIAIAHRLNTVKQANLILVMVEGSIVESGTHDDLMRLGQHYPRLVRLYNGVPLG